MAKAHTYSLSQKAQDIISLVAAWRATPENLRDHKSLEAIAKAHGYRPDSRFYELAESAEVYQQILVTHAGKAIEKIPAILETCSEMALGGSAKHTEIYLEWCRKLITDTTFLGIQRPTVSIADTLEHITSQIDRIADFLNAVPVEAESVTSVAVAPGKPTLASLSEHLEDVNPIEGLPSNRGELVRSSPLINARIVASS